MFMLVERNPSVNFRCEDFKELNATVIIKNEAGEERILTKLKEDVSIYATDKEGFVIEEGKSYFLQVDAPELSIGVFHDNSPPRKSGMEVYSSLS